RSNLAGLPAPPLPAPPRRRSCGSACPSKCASRAWSPPPPREKRPADSFGKTGSLFQFLGHGEMPLEMGERSLGSAASAALPRYVLFFLRTTSRPSGDDPNP